MLSVELATLTTLRFQVFCALVQERHAGVGKIHKKGRNTLYASRASLLSEGTLPLEYFPLSTPDASGLQIVVPAMLICL